jgi:hypothetical protein
MVRKDGKMIEGKIAVSAMMNSTTRKDQPGIAGSFLRIGQYNLDKS